MTDGESGGAPSEQAGGITRRQALKRGALLGGALAWATPVVQVIGMRPAFAQVPSPTCTIRLSVLCFTLPQEVCDCIDACIEAGGGLISCLFRCLEGVPPGDIGIC
jgi:hypothetical protein